MSKTISSFRLPVSWRCPAPLYRSLPTLRVAWQASLTPLLVLSLAFPHPAYALRAGVEERVEKEVAQALQPPAPGTREVASTAGLEEEPGEQEERWTQDSLMTRRRALKVLGGLMGFSVGALVGQEIERRSGLPPVREAHQDRGEAEKIVPGGGIPLRFAAPGSTLSDGAGTVVGVKDAKVTLSEDRRRVTVEWLPEADLSQGAVLVLDPWVDLRDVLRIRVIGMEGARAVSWTPLGADGLILAESSVTAAKFPGIFGVRIKKDPPKDLGVSVPPVIGGIFIRPEAHAVSSQGVKVVFEVEAFLTKGLARTLRRLEMKGRRAQRAAFVGGVAGALGGVVAATTWAAHTEGQLKQLHDGSSEQRPIPSSRRVVPQEPNWAELRKQCVLHAKRNGNPEMAAKIQAENPTRFVGGTEDVAI